MIRVLLCASIATHVVAWHRCASANSNGSGICPDGNRCCAVDNSSSFTCISGNNETQGECCTDDDDDDAVAFSSGCKEGFRCARSDNASNYSHCSRIDPNDHELPATIPRYHLCRLPDMALKEVYGLPILSALNSSRSALAAYFSTVGAMDSSEPDILVRQAAVETVWIVVHGSARNADDYICCASSALEIEFERRRKNSNTTMIIAPWLLAPNDPAVHITPSGMSPLRWHEKGPIPHTWRFGANAIQYNVSSYEVTDEIIRRLLQDHGRFPSLRRIIVAGHSAGGQYVQRWALLSNGQAFADPGQSYIPRVPTRVVVANPKSFCWLDGRRVFNGTLRKPEPDAVYICPTYNEWEWGFENSTASSERMRLDSPYKDRAIRDAGGVKAIIDRYPSRDIVYLAGEKDVLLNGDCEAKMQGPYRRVRSENFFASLREIYGRPVHHRLVVSGVHHDHCLMFQSPEGRQALFGTF